LYFADVQSINPEAKPKLHSFSSRP